MQVSPAAVVTLAAPGRMSEVALCVSVSAPAKRKHFTACAAVPNDVIVVVPVICTLRLAAAPISQVAAEATSLSAARKRMPPFIRLTASASDHAEPSGET